jgi:signal peptidase
MPLALRAIRVTRLTLDVMLLVLIAFVVAMLVLARGIPLATGGHTFVVAGASMEPAIPMGAVVHVEPVEAASLRPGDVVSIRVGPEQAVFTHRIVRVATLPAWDGQATHLETKGDANERSDPSLVPATAVIGRMTLAVPFAGFGVALLGTMQGVALLVAIALLLLAATWLLESFEEDHHEATRAGMTPVSPVGRGIRAA